MGFIFLFFFSLFGVAFLDTYKLCNDHEKDIYQIDKLITVPDPPCRGGMCKMETDGMVGKELKWASAHIYAYHNGNIILDGLRIDVCEFTPCPIRHGAWNFTHTELIPKFMVLNGHYTGNVTVWSPNKERVSCIVFDFQMKDC